jgi:predicted DNA binding CopG/RHH family protein
MADILKDRKKDERLTIRLPAELAELARKKAEREGRPLSAVVRDLLLRWLQQK